MTRPPPSPKLYHITHVDNLASMVREGGLQSDAEMMRRGGPRSAIGLNSIKERRLTLPVKCWPGDCVGDYVPFYYCPRSIMLYILHMANHPELTYRGGQQPIVHLQLDLHQAVEWAEESGCRWAISLSNAGAVYAEFRNDLASLREIDWAAVDATDFRSPEVKEGKQAEFLLHGVAPWHLVRHVGVFSAKIMARVIEAIGDAEHRPQVAVERRWYY